MADNDWKQRLGVVFSTNPDFQYQSEEQETVQTLPPDRQKLRVGIDRRARAGKQVTLVSGFVGTQEDLEALGRTLKTKMRGGRQRQGRRNSHPGGPPRPRCRFVDGDGIFRQTGQLTWMR